MLQAMLLQELYQASAVELAANVVAAVQTEEQKEKIPTLEEPKSREFVVAAQTMPSSSKEMHSLGCGRKTMKN